MNLAPKLIIWLAFSLLAIVMLARMMDMRRAKLAQMLQVYVEARLQWAKKRANATRLAQQLARKKSDADAKEADSLQLANMARQHQNAPTTPTAGPVKAATEPAPQSKAA